MQAMGPELGRGVPIDRRGQLPPRRQGPRWARARRRAGRSHLPSGTNLHFLICVNLVCWICVGLIRRRAHLQSTTCTCDLHRFPFLQLSDPEVLQTAHHSACAKLWHRTSVKCCLIVQCDDCFAAVGVDRAELEQSAAHLGVTMAHIEMRDGDVQGQVCVCSLQQLTV